MSPETERRRGGRRPHVTAALIAGVFLSVVSPGAAGQAIDDETADELDALIEASSNPGLVVAVTAGDEILFESGFGSSNIETGDRARSDMAFRNGSTTKMMVAAALVDTLADNGIDAATPIGRYVEGLDEAIARLTVDQLLTHTAGLADSADDFGVHDETALAENVESKSARDFFAEPGAVFSYSNPGYDTAGYLLARLSGDHFADAFRRRLLEPAGMRRSMFRATMAMTYPFALGHEVDDDGNTVVIRPMPDNSAEWPSGLMYTTVGDLARFAAVLMQGGVAADGTRVLRRSTVDALTRGRVEIPGDRRGASYGYGINVLEIDERRVWMHGGAIAGFRSRVVMLPDTRIAVVAMTNGNDDEVLTAATDLLFSRLAGLRLAEEEPQTRELDPLLASRLSGDYGQTSIEMRLRAAKGRLTLVDGEGKALGVVRQVDGDNFVIEGEAPANIHVTWASDGQPRYLHRGSRALRPMLSTANGAPP